MSAQPRSAGAPTTVCSRASTVVGHYHFELVNLGYGAYLALYELCRRAFPDIADQTIAKMVAGIDVVALRPDDELKRLAVRAIELGVGAEVRQRPRRDGAHGCAGGHRAGERWLAAYGDAKDPWFCFSYGNGLYHHHRSWIDDPTLPIAMIGSYVARLEAGEDILRPRDAVARRARPHHRGVPRAATEQKLAEAFDRQLALARTVFPHIEDHNFYVDHWSHTVLWNKVREFGALLAIIASSLIPRTCSSCATTRCARRSRSSGSTGARRRRGPQRPGLLAPDRRTPQDDL